MEFLNDHLAWKGNDTPPPFDEVETEKWYWIKAEISDKKFTGKIWPDGEKEPKKWLLESKLDLGGLRPASGQVGLNGGSSSGAPAKTVVSFDNWAICEKAGECDPDVILTVEATVSERCRNELRVHRGLGDSLCYLKKIELRIYSYQWYRVSIARL